MPHQRLGDEFMLNSILIALSVVATVGLCAGIMLALASHFFSVPENQTAKLVRECLPGANCGACGYAGCDDYAKAVAENNAPINLCIPGGGDTSSAISEIVGGEAGNTEKKVAFVNCNGNCNAAAHKAQYEGISSCKAESMIYGGSLACRFGCLGKGDCADVCPVDAICVTDDVARIDINKCIGCGLCVKTCPKNLISLVPVKANALVMCNNKEKGASARKNCKNACIGCKKCELNCPEKAIKVENNLAVIDFEKCTGCKICVENCPTKCIKAFDFSSGKIGV